MITAAWPWVCRLWVALPMLGWLPGIAPREAFEWWLTTASLGVISVGLHQTPRQPCRVFGAIALGGGVIWVLHRASANSWYIQTVLWLVAAHLIAERGQFRWLRESVVACAWLQVPIALWQWWVPGPWLTISSWPWGSLGYRTPTAVLLGLASIWETGRAAWELAVLSALTMSWTGAVIPFLRMSWGWVRRMPLIGLGCVAAGVAMTSRWWLARLLPRWDVWTHTLSWMTPKDWLLGYGFWPMLGGFQDNSPVGQAMRWRDSHSVPLDWLIRTGVPGALLGATLLWWMWRASWQGQAWRRWTLAYLVWISCLQSLEPFPVLSLCYLVWLVGLTREGDDARAV